MPDPKAKQVKLTDFIPDPNNANKGTERGRGMLERSLTDLGAGRSIVSDKNGVILAGNKTLETAVESGFENAIVVETDGTKLVVVKRVDLDLATDEKAKKLAIADNRVSEVDLNFDSSILTELSEQIDLSDMFTDAELNDLADRASKMNEDDRNGEGKGKGRGAKEIYCECPECGHRFIQELN